MSPIQPFSNNTPHPIAYALDLARSLNWSTAGRCVRVIDGDTILIDTQPIPVTVRINGIDAPEIYPYRNHPAHYAFASARLAEALLLYAVLETAPDPSLPSIDPWGRSLLHVRVQNAQLLFAPWAVLLGAARVRTDFPCVLTPALILAQRRAIEHATGQWALPPNA